MTNLQIIKILLYYQLQKLQVCNNRLNYLNITYIFSEGFRFYAKTWMQCKSL